MGDAPENKEDSGDKQILALPQLSETKALASQWRPKFLQGLLAPVLRSEASADFRSKAVALGGPPRNPDRAVTKDKGATLLPIVPVAEKPVVVSTRQLGRWPVKPPRNPRQPRSAARRLLALQDGNSQLAKPPLRPMSPNAVAEALYTRDLLGGEPAIWRGRELDGQVAGREEELLEFARHRLDCQLAAQRQGREQAARWRDRQTQKEAFSQLSWMLEGCIPGRPVSPLALDPSVLSSRLNKTSYLKEEDLILKADLDTSEDDLDEMLTKDIAPPPSPELEQPEDDEEDEDAAKKKKRKNRARPSIMSKDLMLRRLAGDLGPLTEEESEEEMRAKQLKDRLKNARSMARIDMDEVLGIDEDVADEEEPATLESLEDHEPSGGMQHLEHSLSTAAVAPASEVEDDVKHYAQKFLSTVTFKESVDFQKVFEPYSKNRMIDQADLKSFLADVGLRPRNEAERSALSQVLMKFNDLEYSFQTVVTDIIPPVRTCLTELWTPRLVQLYKEADIDASGMLSIQELDRILRRSGYSPGIPKVIEAVLDVMPDSLPWFSNVRGEMLLDRNVVDLHRFAVLAPLLQERTLSHRFRRAREISEAEDLDAETQRLWGLGIVDLELYFLKWAEVNVDRKERLLPVSALHKVATQTGLLNRRGPTFRRTLLDLAKDTYGREGADVPTELSQNLHLTLGQVIQILSVIRREECARASRVFMNADQDNSNGLSLRECLRCLHDCGTQVINRSESMLIRKLVDEFDLDGSGELELDEFLELLKFVSLRLTEAHHINASDKARRLGFTDEECECIWEVFLDSDQNLNEQLDQGEIYTAITQVIAHLAWDTTISREALEHLLLDLGYMSPARRLEVTIWDFISILKCCKERGNRPKIALKLGLESDVIAGLIEMWEGLHPSAADTVPVKALRHALKKMPGKGVDSKLARLRDEKTDVVSFTLFLQIMSRTFEPTADDKKPEVDPDRPMRKLQFGSIEVVHGVAQTLQRS